MFSFPWQMMVLGLISPKEAERLAETAMRLVRWSVIAGLASGLVIGWLTQ